MKVIFLDIDGVLNSNSWFKTVDPNQPADELWSSHFDPSAVGLFNQVFEAAEAWIVVSSAWREMHPWEDLLRILSGNGIDTDLIIGRTPSRMSFQPRGMEIANWLRNRNDVEGIAIIDDGDDMDYLTPWLVKTEWETGIQEDHVVQLLSTLSLPWPGVNQARKEYEGDLFGRG